MYNPMLEELKKLNEKVKELTKTVAMNKLEIKILKAKLEEKENDGDNKTNS